MTHSKDGSTRELFYLLILDVLWVYSLQARRLKLGVERTFEEGLSWRPLSQGITVCT